MIVSTYEQLITCLQNGAPFMCDPNFKTVCFPYTTDIILPFIEYLKEDTTITCLIMLPREWKEEDLDEFVTCLSSLNRGIIKLEFMSYDFEPIVIEAFVEILTKNKRIKSIQINQSNHGQLKLPLAL